jgi:hypothetical protein
MKQIGIVLLIGGIAAVIPVAVLFSACRSAVPTVHAAEGRLAAIVIDYPLNGSIFPPEITAPAFIWRDSSEAANLWRIEVKFADGSAAMQFESRGELEGSGGRSHLLS